MKIAVNFIGIPRLYIDGRSVFLPTQKITALVFYLLYEKEALRSRLASMFWEDKTDNLASGNLRNALYQIKKNVSEALFIVNRRTVKVSPEAVIVTDLDELASLSQCPLATVKKLGADFMAGMAFEGEEFHDWLSHRRQEQSEAFAAQLELRIERRAAAGIYEDAAHCLKLLIELDNFNESYYLRLMRIYADTGRDSRAIKLYSSLKRLLSDELRTTPCQEIETLYKQIVNGRRAKRTSVVTGNCLFGREKEIQAIMAHVKANAAARNIYISVSGPPGIGKSTLVNHLLPRLSPSLPLFCRGHEASLKYRFSPWNSFFRDLSREIDPAKIKDHLKLHLLKTCFPSFEVDCHLPDNTDFSPLLQPRDPLTLGELLAKTMAPAVAGSKRRVVVLENFQWFDQDSVEMLLSFLTSASNLLVIVLCRSGTGSGHSVLERIARECSGRMCRIKLEPFSPEQTAAFFSLKLRSILSEKEKNIFYAETEGVPFYMSEMLNILKDGLVVDDFPQMSGLIDRRLNALTDRQRRILEIMSAFTAEVFYTVFIALFKNPEIDDNEMLLMSEDIEILCRKGFINEHLSSSNNLKLSFTHERIKSHVYSQMSEFKRRSLHAKIARTLEGMAMKNVWGKAFEDETLFHHHKSVNEPAALCFQLMRLRRHVIINHELFPVIEDSDLRLCALPFSTRSMTENLLNEAEAMLTNLKANYPAGEELNQATALYREVRGSYSIYYGSYTYGAYAVEQALKYARTKKQTYMIMRCLQQLTLMAIQQECASGIEFNAKRLLKTAVENKSELFIAAVLRFQGVNREIEGDYQQAEKLFLKSENLLRHLAKSGEHYTLNILAAKNYAGELYHRRGEAKRAVVCFEECLAECCEKKLFWGRPLFNSNIAYAALSLGDHAKAERHINESIRLFETSPSGRRNSMSYSLKAYLEAVKGDTINALDYLQTGEDLCCQVQKKSWMALQYWVKYAIKNLPGFDRDMGPGILSGNADQYREMALHLFKSIHFDPRVLTWR